MKLTKYNIDNRAEALGKYSNITIGDQFKPFVYSEITGNSVLLEEINDSTVNQLF